MRGQSRAPPRPGLGLIVGGDVLVAEGVGLADGRMWVVANDDGRVVSGNPPGEGRGREIIERRLAALLMPGRVADIFGLGQSVALDQPTHVFVVPNFVRRFKERIDNAVGDGQ